MHPYGGPLSTTESTRLIHARRVVCRNQTNDSYQTRIIWSTSLNLRDRRCRRMGRVGRAIVIILQNQHMSATRSTDTVPPRNELELFCLGAFEAFLMANAGAQMTRDGPPSGMLSRGHISIIASMIRGL